MKDYIITCESTIDLNVDLVNKYNIKYLDNIYYLDDVEYHDDLKDNLQASNFYAKLDEGKTPKTTQINMQRFYDFFYKKLKEGKDIIHLSFSSGLSGTYNQAVNAKNKLKEEFKNNKIIIVDSLSASSGYGLLLIKAINLQEKGLTIHELEKELNLMKYELNHWFYSTDLTYYIKGGRITKAEGFIGKTLNICPILNVNDEGKLIPRQKVIGKKRVLKRMINVINKHIKDANLYNDYIYISHSGMLEEVVNLKDTLIETYPNVLDVVINDVGPFIGSHTGRGTVAVFFIGSKREK